MDHQDSPRFTAFAGLARLAAGPLEDVAIAARRAVDAGAHDAILVFDDATGDQVDVDLRGSIDDVRRAVRHAVKTSQAPDLEVAGETPRGPGRPRLGVVAREVTLLPRHWEWLAAQPGGASVALRRLVEQARKANEGRDRQRRDREAVYRFASAVAGNLEGYEEAMRALFAGDAGRFAASIAAWPTDVQAYARSLAGTAFAPLPE